MSDMLPPEKSAATVTVAASPLPPRHNGASLGERLQALVERARAQLTPAQQAAIVAALSSTKRTAVALAGLLVTNWYATGMHESLGAYARANLVGLIVGQIIAPSIIAVQAHRAVTSATS